MATSLWVLDPTHSEIGFKIKHLMITNVSGKFNSVEATIENEDDTFETSKIRFSAETLSIDTNNEERDGHLKGGDFFDVAEYPTLTFVATNIIQLKEGGYTITGDLTIKGHTKSITLAAEYSPPILDPWMQLKAGLSVTGKINRKDFGLEWNTTLEAGGMLVGEEVSLIAEMQFIKQQVIPE
ncbi:YceI family protein [Flavobacterium sp. N1994]|uniref:YceI family protein n=1 Tax=Flavobacterium sp. N1994 TaxID=2986827 RepID=UPI0022231016|nr:YceI family protein [Flavobacterium sp. N1994]